MPAHKKVQTILSLLFSPESPFVGLTEVFNEFVDEVSTEVEH